VGEMGGDQRALAQRHATAKTACTVLSINGAELQGAIREDPEFALIA